MNWKIDENLPIWSQLSEHILAEIIAGRFPPGARLPSVRELAAEAGVNPNTMQRAFSDLEMRGLVMTNRTAGRSVTTDGAVIQALRKQQAERCLDAFLLEMQGLGFQKEEIKTAVLSALAGKEEKEEPEK